MQSSNLTRFRYCEGVVCELDEVVVVLDGTPGCSVPFGAMVGAAGLEVVSSVVVETVCGGGEPQAASVASPPMIVARNA